MNRGLRNIGNCLVSWTLLGLLFSGLFLAIPTVDQAVKQSSSTHEGNARRLPNSDGEAGSERRSSSPRGRRSLSYARAQDTTAYVLN